MHGAVGTALGGVCTIVGEPQNLLIATVAGWEFIEFFTKMAPITMPVFIAGILTCLLVEKFSIAGFGSQLPSQIKLIFNDYAEYRNENITDKDRAELLIESLVAVFGNCAVFSFSSCWINWIKYHNSLNRIQRSDGRA